MALVSAHDVALLLADSAEAFGLSTGLPGKRGLKFVPNAFYARMG